MTVTLARRTDIGLAAFARVAWQGETVAIAPEALENVKGALCARFDAQVWRAALQPYTDSPDPRIAGRAHAEPYSSDAMAARVIAAWRRLLEQP